MEGPRELPTHPLSSPQGPSPQLLGSKLFPGSSPSSQQGFSCVVFIDQTGHGAQLPPLCLFGAALMACCCRMGRERRAAGWGSPGEGSPKRWVVRLGWNNPAKSEQGGTYGQSLSSNGCKYVSSCGIVKTKS